MQFASPHLKLYRDEILVAAEAFGLDPEHIFIESFSPDTSAIFIEKVGERKFKIHANLQEKRIIAVKQLDQEEGEIEAFEKYLIYMK